MHDTVLVVGLITTFVALVVIAVEIVGMNHRQAKAWEWQQLQRDHERAQVQERYARFFAELKAAVVDPLVKSQENQVRIAGDTHHQLHVLVDLMQSAVTAPDPMESAMEEMNRHLSIIVTNTRSTGEFSGRMMDLVRAQDENSEARFREIIKLMDAAWHKLEDEVSAELKVIRQELTVIRQEYSKSNSLFNMMLEKAEKAVAESSERSQTLSRDQAERDAGFEKRLQKSEDRADRVVEIESKILETLSRIAADTEMNRKQFDVMAKILGVDPRQDYARRIENTEQDAETFEGLVMEEMRSQGLTWEQASHSVRSRLAHRSR